MSTPSSLIMVNYRSVDTMKVTHIREKDALISHPLYFLDDFNLFHKNRYFSYAVTSMIFNQLWILVCVLP